MHIHQMAPITMALSNAGLGAGTTTTYTTASAVHYTIHSLAYTKAAQTNAATPTTDAITGATFSPVLANQGSVFLFSFDAAGNVKVTQGSVQALDTVGQFIISPQLPSMLENTCPFGYLVLKGGSTLAAPWIFGTSNMSGVTGATYSFKSVVSYPARPVIS